MTQPTDPRVLGAKLGDIAIDLTGVTGMGLITYGAHQVYGPAAYITGGVFLLIAAWKLARSAA